MLGYKGFLDRFRRKPVLSIIVILVSAQSYGGVERQGSAVAE